MNEKNYRCLTKYCRKEPSVRLPNGKWKCDDCWEKQCDECDKQ